METAIVLIITGFIFLIKGADWLVEGGSNIAKKLHIPELVIGMTIVSIGTSLPELIVSVQAAMQGHSDMSIGNIVGSNIVNLFLILSICTMVKGLPFKKQTKYIDNFILIFATAMLLVVANNGIEYIITRTEGFVLLGACVLYMIYNSIMALVGEKFDAEEDEKEKSDEEKAKEKEERKKISILKSLVGIAIGCIALKYGGDFVVDNAVIIAEHFGMTEKMISVTIIAIGTSLPELVTSVIATRKGDLDLAIGNIIGSCICNIFLIIGLSAVIAPITYSVGYNADLTLLFIGTLLFAAFPFIGTKDTMTIRNGFSFFILYLIYFANTIYFQ